MLPDPGTHHPFSSAVQNGWFQTIDAEVGSARSRLTVLEDLPKRHGLARRAATQSLPSSGNPSGSANTALVFDTNVHADGVTYSTSGLTIQEDGLYLVEVRLAISANSAGYRYLDFKVNGVVIPYALGSAQWNNGATHSTSLDKTDIVPFVAGDVITIFVGQASGNTLDVRAGASLEVLRIAPKPYTRMT